MGRFQVIKGGQGRDDTESDDEGLDDSSTIIGVPIMPKAMPAPKVTRTVGDAMFDDASVDDALSKLSTPEPPAAPAPRPSDSFDDIDGDTIARPFTQPVMEQTVDVADSPYNQPYANTIPPPSRRVDAPIKPMTQPFPAAPAIKAPTRTNYTQPPPTQSHLVAPRQIPQTTPPPPMALPPAPPANRNKLVLAIAAGAVLVGAAAVGVFALVNRGSSTRPAPAPVIAPVVQPTPPPTPPVVPPQPVKDPKQAGAAAELASLEHPVLETVVARSAGQLVKLADARALKAGDELAVLKSRSPASARISELTKNVSDLEVLAKEDTGAYGPMLATARRELEAARQPTLTTVRAPIAGLVVPVAKVGDDVQDKAVLAKLVDGRVWIGIATFATAQPTATWSCAIATPDSSHTATCKIQSTEVVAGATRVTIEVAANATWLDGPVHPRLLVEPPAR